MLLVVLLVAASIAVLLGQGVAILLAYEMPRLDAAPPERPARPRGRVSVVIAARNEGAELPGTLDALLLQDYPELEVVVVDGGSTDGSRTEVDRRAPRVRWIDEPPLPPGWVGKNWACSVGAQATDGEWLLFLDADVRLAPATVRTTVEWAEREGAELATIAPRLEMVGFWERTVLPFYVQMVLTTFRSPHTNRDRSKSAMANGQYWLVRRVDYRALGGHEAVRAQILEDVAIARRFRAAGKRLRLAWAPDLATTRMYTDRRELFEGLAKNVHGTRFSAARQVGLLAFLVGLFWLPLGLLPFGIVTGSVPLVLCGALLYVALFGKHVAFARTTGAPAAYGLLYPVAVGFYVAAVLTSLVRGLRGRGVPWKGRTYPLRP
ncbi:MAG TPA: glycosyltransferase family 2 protein [Thermoplasmata archaeon]|nr:glycosyltransferase family 2 protein [Thermoplasmata archaeon]